MDDDAIGLLIFYLCIAVGTGFGACIRVSVGRESITKQASLFIRERRKVHHALCTRQGASC